MGWNPEQTRAQVSRVDRLLTELAAHRDSPGGALGAEAVQALVELYGEALSRIVATAAEADALDPLTGDELLGHLLLVHGLHPVPAEERIRRALHGARPFLDKHRADAELLGVDGDTVRLRVGAQGCASTGRSVVAAVGDLVRAAAPEITHLRVEEPRAAPVLIPVEHLTGTAERSA